MISFGGAILMNLGGYQEKRECEFECEGECKSECEGECECTCEAERECECESDPPPNILII